MKKLILLAVLFLSFGLTSAQNGKYRILVDYFAESGTHSERISTPVRNQIIGGINATNRVIVIDADTEKNLYLEEDRRNDVATLSDNTARMGEMRKLGANFLMNGNVDNLTTAAKRNDDGKRYYEAELSVTIKITNIADGSIFVSESFVTSGGGSYTESGETREGAITAAIRSVGRRMRDFIDINYPLKAEIVELKEQKRGKLLSCYVNLGTEHGVSAGQYIMVSKITTIAGRRSQLEIGQMKITQVVAGDLSECKVTKGGKDILEVFNGGVDELTLQTIKDKSFFGLF